MLSGQFTLPYSLLGIKSGDENQFKLPLFHKWRFDGEWYVPIGRARGAEKTNNLYLKRLLNMALLDIIKIYQFRRLNAFNWEMLALSNQFGCWDMM